MTGLQRAHSDRSTRGPFLRTAGRIWGHPANAGRRGRRIARWLAWQAWERVVRRPWVVTMPPDIAVEVAPHDVVASGVLYCGLPDWPEMPFLCDYLRHGDVMVDVGANVGLYSLLASRVGARVIAFEPADDTRARAEANFARNRLAVDLRACAVGATAGRASFTAGLGPVNRLVASDEMPPPGAVVRAVDVVTLDGEVSGPVAAIKIDVEGHEDAVLEGAARLLRSFQPALVLEANDPDALTARLQPLGYEWVTYEPRLRRLRPSDRAPVRGENAIAVADLAAATARLQAAAS